jgi:hypothetical protein
VASFISALFVIGLSESDLAVSECPPVTNAPQPQTAAIFEPCNGPKQRADSMGVLTVE